MWAYISRRMCICALIRRVCVGCGAAVALLGVSACVCFCWVLASVSRDRSLAYPSSPRRSRRGGHSKQTQNSHPHAYTLFGGMPIADLRWGRCGLQMPQTHACTHTHAPFPSSEAAKTHSDSSEAEPPPCSMELPSLPHTHKYTFSCSLYQLIFYLMAACILELMFSPSVFDSLSFSRSAISVSPCSLGLVILSFPLCSSRWLLWITAVAFAFVRFHSTCRVSGLFCQINWTCDSVSFSFKPCFCPVVVL